MQLLYLAENGSVRIDITNEIISEIMRVLREDFAWEGYRLHFMRLWLLKIANLVSPTLMLRVVDDPDDDRILECAIEAGSDFIVTNDNDLLRLKEYSGIKIVRANNFLRDEMGR